MCNCMNEIDAQLAPTNTRIEKVITFRPSGLRLRIATEVIEKKRGARPVTLFASFCPFCGEAIAKEGA